MLSVLSLSLLFFLSVSVQEDSLKIVHVIFRHGEKNPDIKHTYPKDPYRNATFKTFSQGQLNNVGRRTMYDLGQTLRKRYDNFLGNIYSEDRTEAWASPYARTRLSLQLVMASLFTPSDEERWHKNLDWQPTIFHSPKRHEDKLFLNMLGSEYSEEYNKVCASDEVQSMIKKYSDCMKYMEKHTGFNFKCTRTAYALYVMLDAEKDANWTLPKWTRQVYPEPLGELAFLEYKIQAFTNKLKRLLIGNLFLKILSDTENRINLNSPLKFHLYSAHESNVYQTLNLLGFATMKPHHPNYGACIIIEVHKINDEYILEVFYRSNKYDNFTLMNSQHGEQFISYEDFKALVRKIHRDVNSSSKLAVNSVWILYYIIFVYLLL